MNKKSGEIKISVFLAISMVISVGGYVAAYYNTLRAVDAKIADANSQIEVLKTQRESLNDSIMEIKASVEKVSDKVDALLINRGIVPDSVLSKNAE